MIRGITAAPPGAALHPLRGATAAPLGAVLHRGVVIDAVEKCWPVAGVDLATASCS